MLLGQYFVSTFLLLADLLASSLRVLVVTLVALPRRRLAEHFRFLLATT